MPNIADIEYAILETSGKLSIIPKSQKRPVAVNPEDLKLETPTSGLPVTLIVDGVLKDKNLSRLNLTHDWLRHERTNTVLFLGPSSSGRVSTLPAFISPTKIKSGLANNESLAFIPLRS